MRHKPACACVGVSLAIVALAAGLVTVHPFPSLAQAPQPIAFSGSVMIGRFSDAAIALYQVRVELYCSNDAGSPGRLLASTHTNTEGSYAFETAEFCECYNVVSGEAPGSISFLADSRSGTVIRSNWIQHCQGTQGADVWGDYFWYAPDEWLGQAATSVPAGQTPAESPRAPAVVTTPGVVPPAVTVTAPPAATRSAAPAWGSRPTIPGAALAILAGVALGALWAYRNARLQRGRG